MSILEVANATPLYISIISIVLLLGSCTTLSDEERDWRQAIDAENWSLCELGYKQAGIPTIHYDHTHKYKNRVRHWMIRSDLLHNRCKSLMNKDYWAHY